MEANEYTDEGRGQFAADGYTDCDTDADRHTDSATRANSNSDIGAADCDTGADGYSDCNARTADRDARAALRHIVRSDRDADAGADRDS
ncbi:MAG: hypothetical protein F4X62_00345 [Caldilineaceae bacterium SB0662_bin_25]|nr:hypothetical protein [Caldilineaceae bacterium SB0662_bin_25]